jgi:hypothetical protein
MNEMQWMYAKRKMEKVTYRCYWYLKILFVHSFLFSLSFVPASWKISQEVEDGEMKLQFLSTVLLTQSTVASVIKRDTDEGTYTGTPCAIVSQVAAAVRATSAAGKKLLKRERDTSLLICI